MEQEHAERIAARLISQLAEGTACWIVPWAAGTPYLPYNPHTGRLFRGANALALLSLAESSGYHDLRWMTAAQARALGGEPRQSEEPTILHLHRRLADDPAPDAQRRDDGDQPLSVIAAEFFNADQIDGLPPTPARPVLPEPERHAMAASMLAQAGLTIEHRPGAHAAYFPGRDCIMLPDRAGFASADSYYRAALHQLAHATAHPDRLARDLSHPIGSPGHAQEELRANIGSLLLGDGLLIGHDPGPHLAYVRHWISILEKDPWELFRAAADAEKIVTVLTQWAQRAQLQEPKIAGRQPGQPHPGQPGARSHIEVPFAEKEQAKALGARWDAKERRWYVPEGISLAPFQRWSQQSSRALPSVDPRQDFASALAVAGFQLDGKLRRASVEGDRRGQRSGAYVGHLDGMKPAGWYRNYRTGETQSWKAEARAALLSPARRSQLLSAAHEQRQAREVARQAIHHETVRLLHEHLAKAGALPFRHPYLVRKGIKPHGALLDRTGPLRIFAGEKEPQDWSAKGNLLITITDFEGTGLLSVLSIAPDGSKWLPRGGMLAGGMRVLGSRKDVPAAGVVVTEGFATGATIQEQTGLPVAIAFSANNLLAVARQFRKAYPDASIYIAGDNDHWKARELDARGRPKPNVGRMAAEQAATATGGIAVLPQFEPADRGTDWNDVAISGGQDAFHAQWQAAVRIGKERLLAAASIRRDPHPQRSSMVQHETERDPQSVSAVEAKARRHR